jgi:hypothetical protein
VARGFDLACIKCGEECCLSLDLNDLETVRCPECDNEYTLEEVRKVIGQWARLLAWVDLAPARQPGGGRHE